jgi:predicted RNase H-like HicB family nuclease
MKICCSHGPAAAGRRFSWTRHRRVATGAIATSNSVSQVVQLETVVKKVKFIVEKHRDGYVAYPLGLKGAVVGQGESYESALADAKSAAAFHIESFGKEAFDDQDDVIEAFVAEASLTPG